MISFHHYPDWQNTYHPKGYERTPHLPLEGQPVSIAAAVESSEESLFLIAARDGRPDMPVAGTFVSQDGPRRFFTFSMEGAPWGSRVEYHFEAGGVRSQIYGFEPARDTTVTAFRDATLHQGSLSMSLPGPFAEELYLSWQDGRLLISATAADGQGHTRPEDGRVIYTDNHSAARVAVRVGQGELDVYDADGTLIAGALTLTIRHTPDCLVGFSWHYQTASTAVYGLGERFDSVNQVGRHMDAMIFEQFTNQGSATYFPTPFYWTDGGHGVFLDTLCRSEYDFGATEPGRFTFGARVGAQGQLPNVWLFPGKPAQILAAYREICGVPALPPPWAFGLWVSANRWNRQSQVEEQLRLIQAHRYPATVLVIEAWSDEATFYLWNDSQYTPTDGSRPPAAADIRYPADGHWPDPATMIRRLHEEGIRTILWQIPVIKHLSEQESANPQHENDERYALANNLCVGYGGGGAYRLPDFWFSGSLLPDFTNCQARDWWFARRQHLLDMGVDGFKTDGGEFIHDDRSTFSDGSTGVEKKNGYAADYLKSYHDFIGTQRTLFSRAGYAGSQAAPIHWAGDQESTWQELRSVLRAGLSVGLSGVPFWSFDIGGFAGPLPGAELYIRSTELAAFVPVMQWHSEPMGGQFAGTASEAVNDRSPWNIAQASGNPDALRWPLYYAHLRRNLQPQLLSEAQKSTRNGSPMMAHLALHWPDDANVRAIEDEFLLGDLLVAPVTTPGSTQREVYLPEGTWLDLWTGEDQPGGRWLLADAPLGRIPLYLRHGGMLALKLGEHSLPGRPLWENEGQLHLLLAGESGNTEFLDEHGNSFEVHWNGEDIQWDGPPAVFVHSSSPGQGINLVFRGLNCAITHADVR